MMDKLMKQVEQLVEEEYGRAGAKFGLTNHSDHESFAVLQEEVDETRVEFGAILQQMEKFWNQVKWNEADSKKYQLLTQMQRKAVLGACEMIQVAAMAKKAAMTVCDRGAVKEFKGEEESS